MTTTLLRPARRPEARGFSPTLASRLLGINYNTILYWTRTRLVRASIQYQSKQWTPVLFSFDDLLELRLVQSLREKGAPTRRIRKALNFLRKHAPEVAYLDVSSDAIRQVSPGDAIRDTLGRDGTLVVFDVGGWRADLEARLSRLTEARRLA